MEKTIEQMERELRAAKLRQEYDTLLTQFHKAKEEYEGKSFGNRRMTYGCLRKYKLESEVCMHHINNVYISTNSYSSDVINTFEKFCAYQETACVKCKGESVILRREEDDSIYISVSRLDCEYKQMGYDAPYAIKENVYKRVRGLVDSSIERVFIENIQEFHDRIHTRENPINLLMKYGHGARLIELTYDEAHTLENHPFLYGRYLLAIPLSLNIVEGIKSEYEEEAKRDVGYMFQGQYIPPCGIAAKAVKILSNVLEKFEHVYK